MESPAFVIVLNQSLRNHNYSVLLPSINNCHKRFEITFLLIQIQALLDVSVYKIS